MARTILWLDWLMSIYRELFTRQIEGFSHTHPRIYLPIDPSIVLLLLIRPLALFLLFWLGSATGHRSHKPTTTPFQYWWMIFYRPSIKFLRGTRNKDFSREIVPRKDVSYAVAGFCATVSKSERKKARSRRRAFTDKKLSAGLVCELRGWTKREKLCGNMQENGRERERRNNIPTIILSLHLE